MVGPCFYTAETEVQFLHDAPNRKVCMKTLISNNGGYKMFAEIINPVRDIGQRQLKFTTQWEDSKNPEEFQNKFECMLTEEEFKRLKDIL